MTQIASLEQKPARRGLLRLLVGLTGLPLVGAGWLLGRDRRRRRRHAVVALPRPTTDGVFFHDEVLLVARGEALQAYSSRCPHLGCTIRSMQGGDLVCPCHGSRFGVDGRRLGGPAPSDLTALTWSPRDGEELLDVVLPS
jgi:Rieske Fe-S protein